jgi:bifunctional non-homologous end joining protein LigD
MRRPDKREAIGTLEFIKPCLAQTANEPPSGEEWVHEIKYDGYRIQAHLTGSKVSLFTRNGLDWTDKFGAVVGDLQKLNLGSAIIDGEAIVQRQTGLADFHALQHELARGPDARVILMAFDLLYLNSEDVRKRPLLARKALLKTVLGASRPATLLQFSDHMLGEGKAVLANACKLGLEGIVSKRADRPYRSGRSSDWLKSKCVLADPFVVVGYVPSAGSSRVIGSLALGYYADRYLTYAGRVGTGFSVSDAAAIWDGLQAIRTDDSPLVQRLTPAQRVGVIWVKPKVVAQVEYRSWTPGGILRHASFKAFRQDKRPSQIHKPPSLDRG